MTSQAITSKVLHANGLDFACDVCGEGDAVALLLHGFPESKISWRHQLPFLADLGWRAIAPDLRGYGESSRPREREAYRLSSLVDDVVALFEAAGAKRRLLIGHDWGAMVAWVTALQRRMPLEGLIVMNVPHPAVFARALRTSWRQMLRSWYIGFFQLPILPELALRAGGAAAIERAFTGMTRNRAAFTPDILEHYRTNAMQPGAATAMINYYRANATGMLRGTNATRPIITPTLLIWGERDTALGLELTEGYDGLVEDFTLFRIADASHWVQQDAPDNVNAAMARWLARER